MLFDKFCQIAERILWQVPILQEVLRQAKLFIIDTKTDISLTDLGYTADIYSKFVVTDFLPFDICAFETDFFNALLLAEARTDEGFLESRKIFFLMPDSMAGYHFEGQDYYGHDCYYLVYGTLAYKYPPIEGLKSLAEIKIHFNMENFVYCDLTKLTFGYSKNKEEILSFLGQEKFESFSKTFKDTADYLSGLLRLINGPDRFVMETTPKIKQKKAPKKLLRSHQRPTYTVLTPTRIRQQMRLSSPGGIGTGGSKAPHDRRQHIRFLSDDKYKYDSSGRVIDPKPIPFGPRMGQAFYKQVVVPATWVGPSRSETKNKIYRVVLDV